MVVSCVRVGAGDHLRLWRREKGACRHLFEDLPAPAQRALKEAEARRKEIDARQKAFPREIDGRGGLEPTRYEDWEIKGIACDF